MTPFRWAAGYRPFITPVAAPSRVAATASVLGAGAEALGLIVLGVAAGNTYHGAKYAVAIIAAIAGSLIAAALARGIADTQFARAQVQLETQLRRDIADLLLTCDWQDFVGQQGHELQAATISEAPLVAETTESFLRGRASLLASAVMFASAFFVSLPAAAICAGFGVLIAAVYVRSTRGYRAVQEQLAQGNAQVTRHTMILVNGLRSLRLSPAQQNWKSRLLEVYDRHADARARHFTTPVRGRLAVEVLSGIMVFVVMITQLAVSGSLIPGLVVMALILRVLPRVQTAQQQLSYSRHGIVWLERWQARMSALNAGPEYRPGSSGAHGATPAPGARSTAASPAVGGHTSVLSLRDIEFSYRGHSRRVLDNVDLDIAAGEWVSLRGESGQGKSTLIDVIGGILHPQHGEITFAGRPLAAYDTADLYRMLVVVPQDVQLMGSTIDDIVTWEGQITPDRPIDEYIRALGIDTMFSFTDTPAGPVDEMSRDISGGMRTRLAMARALAGGPKLLVLDETTSRLHAEAEREIFATIRKLLPNLAVLVVTHRSETLELVDRRLRLVSGALQPDAA